MRPTKFDETHLRNLLLFSTKNQNSFCGDNWKLSVCAQSSNSKEWLETSSKLIIVQSPATWYFGIFYCQSSFNLWIYASLIKRSCTQIVLPHLTVVADVINCFNNFSNNELMSFLKSTPLEDEWYSLKMMKCQSPIVQI